MSLQARTIVWSDWVAYGLSEHSGDLSLAFIVLAWVTVNCYRWKSCSHLGRVCTLTCCDLIINGLHWLLLCNSGNRSLTLKKIRVETSIFLSYAFLKVSIERNPLALIQSQCVVFHPCAVCLLWAEWWLRERTYNKTTISHSPSQQTSVEPSSTYPLVYIYYAVKKICLLFCRLYSRKIWQGEEKHFHLLFDSTFTGNS